MSVLMKIFLQKYLFLTKKQQISVPLFCYRLKVQNCPTFSTVAGCNNLQGNSKETTVANIPAKDSFPNKLSQFHCGESKRWLIFHFRSPIQYAHVTYLKNSILFGYYLTSYLWLSRLINQVAQMPTRRRVSKTVFNILECLFRRHDGVPGVSFSAIKLGREQSQCKRELATCYG